MNKLQWALVAVGAAVIAGGAYVGKQEWDAKKSGKESPTGLVSSEIVLNEKDSIADCLRGDREVLGLNRTKALIMDRINCATINAARSYNRTADPRISYNIVIGVLPESYIKGLEANPQNDARELIDHYSKLKENYNPRSAKK